VSITKATARSRVLAFMDAAGSQRWDTTANGEVDQALGYVADQEWRTILDANPYAKTQAISTPIGLSGQVTKAVLSSGSGDSARRLYKVLGVYVDNTAIKIEPFSDDYFGALFNPGPSYVGYEFGDYFQFFPVTLTGNSTWFVNYLPQRQDALATDSSVFQFPDSFEDIPILGAAAYLLASKGGAEADAAVPLVGLAKNRRIDMLRTLERPTTAPGQIRYVDSSAAWGQ